MAWILLVIAFSSIKGNHTVAQKIASSLLKEEEMVRVLHEYLDSPVVQDSHSRVVSIISALMDEKMKKIEDKTSPQNKKTPHIV